MNWKMLMIGSFVSSLILNTIFLGAFAFWLFDNEKIVKQLLSPPEVRERLYVRIKLLPWLLGEFCVLLLSFGLGVIAGI